jgi:hypothetical protein
VATRPGAGRRRSKGSAAWPDSSSTARFSPG